MSLSILPNIMSVLCPLSSTGRWLSCWGSPRWLSVYWHSSVPVIWCPESVLPNPSNLNDCPWRAYICRHGLCISVMISVPAGHKFIFISSLILTCRGTCFVLFPLNVPFHLVEFIFQPMELTFHPMEFTFRPLERKNYRWQYIVLYAVSFGYLTKKWKKVWKILWCKNFFLYLSVKIYSWEFNLFNMCLI